MTSMRRQRVMLVDDHEVVRLGLKALIERQPEMEVVAEAATAPEALTKSLAFKPDVIVMDIRLGGSSGIDACREINNQLPGIKIIMLTSFAEDEMLFAAIRAGAVGYVLKQAGAQEVSAFAQLTEQERRVLLLVAEGKTTREIAQELHLGQGTVRNYVSNILSKLGLANRAEAAAYATRHNLKGAL